MAPDSPIGLSGLSELMQRETPALTQDIAPPQALPSKKPAIRHPNLHARDHHRRRTRLILMGLMVMAVGVLGFGFWYATSIRLRPPTHTLQVDRSNPHTAPRSARMKLVAQPLMVYPWVIVNEPYVENAHAPDPLPIPLTVTQAQIDVQDNGQAQVALTLRYDGEGLMTHAQIQLSLVNAQGVERCRTTANVGFIPSGQSVNLHADVPPALRPRQPQVKITVLNHRAMFDPIMLEDVQVQSLADATGLRITWPHKVANMLGEIAFSLTAQGPNPSQHAVYQVHLIDPQTAQIYIKNAPQVSFDVEVPTAPTWDVATWHVQAAAQ